MRSRRIGCLMKIVLCSLVITSTPAKAEWAALKWDACGSQVVSKRFACDSNPGESRMVVFAYRDSVGFFTSAFTCSLDVVVEAQRLPSWWMLGTTECRAGALVESLIPDPADVQCTDAWQGELAHGMVIASDATSAQTHLWIEGVDLTETVQMTAHVEVFVVALTLRHDKSVGASSCAGCSTSACVLLRDVTFVDENGGSTTHMPLPPEQTMLVWQGGSPSCAAVPIRNRTWSDVKALYR